MCVHDTLSFFSLQFLPGRRLGALTRFFFPVRGASFLSSAPRLPPLSRLYESQTLLTPSVPTDKLLPPSLLVFLRFGYKEPLLAFASSRREASAILPSFLPTLPLARHIPFTALVSSFSSPTFIPAPPPLFHPSLLGSQRLYTPKTKAFFFCWFFFPR